MKITRIDERTVRCLISGEDLEQQGISIEDLFYKNPVAMDFLRDLMEQAADAVGYRPARGFMPMQISVLSDGSLDVTLIEAAEDDLQNALEHLTEGLGVQIPDRILKDIGEAPENERMQKLREFVANLKDFTEMFRGMVEKNLPKKSPLQETEQGGKVSSGEDKRLKFESCLFSFPNFSELSRFSRMLPGKKGIFSTLYRDEREWTYLLRLDLGLASEKVYASIFTMAYEYGQYLTSDRRVMAHVEEHAEGLIIGNAIEILSKM